MTDLVLIPSATWKFSTLAFGQVVRAALLVACRANARLPGQLPRDLTQVQFSAGHSANISRGKRVSIDTLVAFCFSADVSIISGG